MSVSLVIDIDGLDEALVRLKPITDFEPAPLMEALAAIGESQTRRRIESEKTAPDGTPWPDNLAGTPILRETGRNLLDSVASQASAEVAEWGAAWEYAHVHQDGMTIVPREAKKLAFAFAGGFAVVDEVTIPARPFVGISDENREELREVVTDYLGIGGAR
ncbi:phage virion morphogenesis protein [Stappia indica]|jgi:phage gpG-like protein|uniref:Mu-like prophage protein gpG n=1 Tax=Stappia indica TaxID=538381 RepID=A0A285TU04_9HYPH|nr:phage virion morphogenesis protein [Stappia indica]SOC26837.1 Mu-like prophage protein gpG [Stappia indica]